MDTSHVDNAVLIQHGGTYDNSYLFECADTYEGRFKVVVMLDPDDTDQAGTLGALKEQGAAGVRLYPDQRVRGDDPLAVWKLAGELGLVVSCLGDVARFASDEFRSLVETCSDTHIVIEHLAGVRKSFEPPYEEFHRALSSPGGSTLDAIATTDAEAPSQLPANGGKRMTTTERTSGLLTRPTPYSCIRTQVMRVRTEPF